MTPSTDPTSIGLPRPSFAVGQAMAVLYLWLFLCAPPSFAHETAPRYGVPLTATTVATIDLFTAGQCRKPCDIAVGQTDQILLICPGEGSDANAARIFSGMNGTFSLMHATEKSCERVPPDVVLFSQGSCDYWAELPHGNVGATSDLKLRIGAIPASKEQPPHYEVQTAFHPSGYRRSSPFLPESRAMADYALDGFVTLPSSSDYLLIGSFDEYRWGSGSWMGESPSVNKLCSIRLRDGVPEAPERIDPRGGWDTGFHCELARSDGSVTMAERRYGYPGKDKSSICILTLPKDGKWSKPEVVATLARSDTPSPAEEDFRHIHIAAGDFFARMYLGRCGTEETLFWGSSGGKLYASRKHEAKWDKETLATIATEHSVDVLDGATLPEGRTYVLFRSLVGDLFLMMGEPGNWRQPVHIAGVKDETRVKYAQMSCAANSDAHIVFVEAKVEAYPHFGEVRYVRVPAEVWKE